MTDLEKFKKVLKRLCSEVIYETKFIKDSSDRTYDELVKMYKDVCGERDMWKAHSFNLEDGGTLEKETWPDD